MNYLKKLLKRREDSKAQRGIEKIKSNAKLLFQMDISRKDYLEMQVFRQISAEQFGIDSIDSDGYLIILIFNPQHPNYNEQVRRFKESKYLELIKVGNSSGSKFPVLLIERDFKLLEKTLKDIQECVYSYNSGDDYNLDVRII